MASLIQDYEQQYAVLSAEITSDIGKINRISGVERKELISTVNSSLDEVQELLEQMQLEIRDANASNKTGLTSRLNCYQAELKRLKQEFVNAKTNRNDTTISIESTDYDNMGESINDEQQRRLLDNSERIERTGNRLADGYRTILETEQIGTTVLQDLAEQREQIQRTRSRLRETNEDLRLSSRIMNSMIVRSLRERAILYGVVFLFIVVVSLSIYLSVSKD
ncbi:hypothetical protein HA402_001545 [Bradysia odoriphaga]|nr:hypothetical protein HA402_001545 [Bradysia odoriphaga]